MWYVSQPNATPTPVGSDNVDPHTTRYNLEDDLNIFANGRRTTFNTRQTWELVYKFIRTKLKEIWHNLLWKRKKTSFFFQIEDDNKIKQIKADANCKF